MINAFSLFQSLVGKLETVHVHKILVKPYRFQSLVGKLETGYVTIPEFEPVPGFNPL